MKIHDMRGAPKSHRARTIRDRNIMEVSAILMHQTAANIRTPEVANKVPAHAMVLPDASVVLMHHWSDYVYHAGAANRFSVGVEISCRAAGLVGVEDTLWRSRVEKEQGSTYADLIDEATDAQLASARDLCGMILDDCLYVVDIMDHRNSSRSRVSDPGERIHREVTAKVASAYGLGTALVVGDGRPTPERWGGEAGALYNWRHH